MELQQIFLVILCCYVRYIDSSLCNLRFKPHNEGYCLRSTVCPGAVLESLCPTCQDDVGCCILENYPYFGSLNINVTKSMFMDVFNNTRRSRSQYERFEYSLRTAGITSCHQQAAFLTHIAHDTKLLTTMDWCPNNIEKMSEDELKYMGRGVVHVSGKEFYTWMKQQLNVDILEMPELLAFPSKAYRSAALIWSHSYSTIFKQPLKHTTYNSLADGSEYGFILLSHYLKGNLNNIDKLLRIWKRVNQVLKCPCVDRHGPQCSVDGRQGQCKYKNYCKGKQVGDFRHCKGPSDVVRCSLDDSTPLDLRIKTNYDLAKSDALDIMKEVTTRVSANPNSRIIITRQHENETEMTSSFKTKTRKSSHQKDIALKIIKSGGHIETKMNQNKRNNKRVGGKMTPKYRLFKRKAMLILDKDPKHGERNHSDINRFKNNTNLIIRLRCQENPFRLIVRDYLLGFEFTTGKAFAGKILMEKVMNGPWHIRDNDKITILLEKNEVIYLAIPYTQQETDSMPILSIFRQNGNINVTGVQTTNDLPAYHDDRCCESCTKHSEIKQIRRPIAILNSDNETRPEQPTIADALFVNSKAIVVIRGLDNKNVLRIRTGQTYYIASNTNGGEFMLTAILSSMWIAMCSFLTILYLSTIINAVKCYQVWQKTIAKVVQSGESEQYVTAPDEETGHLNVQHSSSNRDQSSTEQLPPSCTSHLILTQFVKKSESIEDKRSLRFHSYIQLFTVLCIMVANVAFTLENMLQMSNTALSINMFCRNFASNSLFIWLLLEAVLALKSNRTKFKISPCKSGKSAMLFASIIGLPAALALIPVIIYNTADQNGYQCNYMKLRKNSVCIDIIIKGSLFMIAMIFWSILLFKEIFQRNKRFTHRWKILSIFVTLALFSANQALSQMCTLSANGNILQYCFSAINFTLGIFIWVSVYQQTKEYVDNMQRRQLYDRNCLEEDDKTIASPAISRNIFSFYEVM